MSSSNMPRRTALQIVAAAPVAASLVWSEREVEAAHQHAAAALASGAVYEPKFFTADEWKTVYVLSDLIIPRDARSGSATEVGVPEFIDFMMIDQPERQQAIRQGLAWLDAESRRRFGNGFTGCDQAQQAGLLDQIAWPKRAPEDLKAGVTFFVAFRDLVLTGFWTTRVGVDDLQYQGNTFVPQWQGCPPAALEKLGVSYR